MIQLVRMILIAALMGVAAAGLVWLLWDIAPRLSAAFGGWRARRREKAQAAALLDQASEPADEERPE